MSSEAKEARRKYRAKFTSEEYTENHSGECPMCGSTEIKGGSIDIEGHNPTRSFQEVMCLNCNAHWQDVYELTGYDLLEAGD